MSSSIKIIQNRHRERADGYAALYLRVIVNRRKKDFPIHIHWPVSHFDPILGLCKPRSRNDYEAEDNNIIIRDEIAKANDVIRHFRLLRISFSLDEFVRELKGQYRSLDFLKYMEQKTKERLKGREISYATFRAYMIVQRRLKKWKSKIPFDSFNENWAWNYEAYLKSSLKTTDKTTGTNNRWKYHKTVKTILNLAKRDRIKFVNPYNYFVVTRAKGTWKALYEEDVKRLYKYYHDRSISKSQKTVLRRFLFCCGTGLRRSDLYRVREDWNRLGILTFIPYKTRKQTTEWRCLWQQPPFALPSAFLSTFAALRFSSHILRSHAAFFSTGW